MHEGLCEILGSRNVYYNPPSSVSMKYPAIKYSLSDVDHKRANDGIYKNTNKYEIIVIDRNPDSDIHETILSSFPMCSFDRPYVANNLYHFILTLYF